MNGGSIGQGNETFSREEPIAKNMNGHDTEEKSKIASNPDIVSGHTGMNSDINQSETSLICINSKNSVDHIEIKIDEEHRISLPSPNAKLSCSNTDSKAEVLIDKPLCADYRSGADSDTDSDSDSDSDSESNTLDSGSDSSSDEEATAVAGELQNGVKKKKAPDDGDLSMNDLPPIENLTISVPEEECEEIGIISGIVGTLVIVEAYKNTPAYDIDSVLFLDKGQKTLGRIFDVFGPVCEPVYSVRFNNAEEIKVNEIKKGLKVYSAPRTEHTSLVFVSELMKMKGSDASWENNEEAPQEFQDFSDDEAEERFRNRGSEAVKSERPSLPEDLQRKKARFYRPKLSQNSRHEFPRNNMFRINSSLHPPPNVSNNWTCFTPRPCFPQVPQNNLFQPPYQYLPRTPLPSINLPRTPLPSSNLPRTPLPSNNLPRTPLPSSNLPRTPLPSSNLPRTPLPSSNLPRTPLPSSNLPRTPLPSNNLPRTPLPSSNLPPGYYGQGYYCPGYRPPGYQPPNYFPNFPPSFPNMQYMYPTTNPFLLPPPGPPPPITNENNPGMVKEFAREPSRPNL